jgi:type II secretory pathway pseudopilin PulG
MANRKSGQTVVEVVVAVVIIALFLTGAVVALLMSVSARDRGLQRKKATAAAEVVVEGLINEKTNNPEAFWELEGVESGTVGGFEGYTYSVGYSLAGDSAVCNVGATDCVEAIIGVNWQGKNNGRVEVRRFFSKKY